MFMTMLYEVICTLIRFVCNYGFILDLVTLLTYIQRSFLDMVVQRNPITIKDISVKNAALSIAPLFSRAARPKLSLVKATHVIA